MFIIATASRLSSNPNILRKMILAGSDILRFNFSYGSPEEKIQSIKLASEIIYELNATTKILIDLPNPKTRLGGFPNKEIYIQEGQLVNLKSCSFSENPHDFLPVQMDNIGDTFYPEQTIIVDEGEVAFKVLNIMPPDMIECIALNSGLIYPFKGLNWKGQPHDNQLKIKAIEKEIMPYLAAVEPAYIACPSTRNPAIATLYLQMIKKIPWRKMPKIIFKIETEEGIQNIEEILPLGDIILLERGNLSINAQFEKMGVYQKKMIRTCKQFGKPIIISTQILESLIHNFTPQRSEISDLTNMVLEGVDGIMLCHETGVNNRPAYPIAVAKKIIAVAEQYRQELKA